MSCFTNSGWGLDGKEHLKRALLLWSYGGAQRHQSKLSPAKCKFLQNSKENKLLP